LVRFFVQAALIINRHSSSPTCSGGMSSTTTGYQHQSHVVAKLDCKKPPFTNSKEENDKASQTREKESMDLQNHLRMLGVDLPSWMLEKITTSYTGMTTMERFLAETGQGSREYLEVQSDMVVSDCGAVASMSEGARYSDGEAR
jgi:hypothetical protein